MKQCTSNDTDESSKPKRSSSSSSSGILLPDVCIFCDKILKYKSRKSERLRKCEVKQVREKLEQCAKEKSDYRVISLASTHDLVAAEAKYHPICYTDYTRSKKIRRNSSINAEENQEYKLVEIEAFQLAVEHCYNSMAKSQVLSFQEVLAIMREHFLENDFSLTPSTRKNLRRNLEKCFGDKLKFISIKNRSFLYSSEINVEKVIADLLEEREQSCYVAKTAQFIHKEIKAMKDEMPWPPQPNDLNLDNYKMSKKKTRGVLDYINNR